MNSWAWAISLSMSGPAPLPPPPPPPKGPLPNGPPPKGPPPPGRWSRPPSPVSLPLLGSPHGPWTGLLGGFLSPSPPEEPGGLPHGPGPPLFQGMFEGGSCKTARCASRWRERVYAPYRIDRRSRRGCFIRRAWQLCKMRVYRTMADASSDALRAALRAIKDPASGRDIVSAGLVEGIEVRGGLVQVALLTDRAQRGGDGAGAAGGRGAAGAPAGRDQRHGGADRAQGAGARRGRRAHGHGQATGRRSRALLPRREGDRRGGLRQGRRRQVHRRGQPGGRAGAAGSQGRPAGRRHLRPQPAAHARAEPQAGGAQRQDDPAAGLGPVLHVDRLPGGGGNPDDLARPDGDGRAGADDGAGRVGARWTSWWWTCRRAPATRS